MEPLLFPKQAMCSIPSVTPGQAQKSFMTFSFWKMSQLSNFPSVQSYLPSKEGIYV